MHLVLLIFAMHSPRVPNVFNPYCVCFMCVRCCWSLLCILDVCLVLLILFVCFPCVLGAFDLLPRCLVFLILFACSTCMHGVFNPLPRCMVFLILFACSKCMHGVFNPLYKHLIFFLSFDPFMFGLFLGHNPSSLVLSIWSSPCLVLPLLSWCLVLFPWLTSSHVFFNQPWIVSLLLQS